MADEDNFDIDIYGDGEGMDEDSKAFYKQEMEKDLALKETKEEEERKNNIKQETDDNPSAETSNPDVKEETGIRDPSEEKKPKIQQGTKRKGDSDERRIDTGATTALMISELHWWTTEDDVRGWINDAGAEDELKEITFSEHKVNGKSKGQVFVEFTSPQASTATKHKIESLSSGPTNNRKFQVAFNNASSNPFKSLPKDAPARAKDDRPQRGGPTAYSSSSHNEYNSNRGNFRGRGNYHNARGGGGYNQGGYNGNRNFSGLANGFNDRSGYVNNNNMNNYNQRGGGMLPLRGGRGGMAGGMMNMPMNMMMANPMGMMAGMGPQGFGGNVQPFNPMFNQGQQGNWSPGYGNSNNKRQRQD